MHLTGLRVKQEKGEDFTLSPVRTQQPQNRWQTSHPGPPGPASLCPALTDDEDGPQRPGDTAKSCETHDTASYGTSSVLSCRSTPQPARCPGGGVHQWVGGTRRRQGSGERPETPDCRTLPTERPPCSAWLHLHPGPQTAPSPGPSARRVKGPELLLVPGCCSTHTCIRTAFYSSPITPEGSACCLQDPEETATGSPFFSHRDSARHPTGNLIHRTAPHTPAQASP